MSDLTKHTDHAQPRWESVERVVFPVKDADLTMPLYALTWTRPKLSDAAVDPRSDKRRLAFENMNKTTFEQLINHGVQSQPASSSEAFRVNSRSQMTLLPNRHVSLCTFFNAFPASYWKRWTAVRRARFSAKVKGSGNVVMFKSNGRGLYAPVDSIEVHSKGDFQSVEAVLEMTGMLDGGYFWCELESASGQPLVLSDAQWRVPVSERTSSKGQASLSIAITTFNRASYCLDQLKTIGQDDGLREHLDTIYCVDQGTELVSEQPDFSAVANKLGSQLTYLRQTNLGGSGGFSRGMLETLKEGRSEYTLLLDDDAISEPEAILRSLKFAQYSRHPLIVGGGMFHLDNRTVLYTQGERFDHANAWTKSSQGLEYDHDFATSSLRDSPERHRRVDVDFNGWWMCLIPTAIMREIGLAMPFFIKFDDVEYALRAAEHGYHTVCLPGVAVWHQAWHGKDPSRTWEEYFLERNRWLCALLHCPKPSVRFVYHMLYGDAKAGLKLVYSAMRLRHMGLHDIMRGPRYVVSSLPDSMTRVSRARQGFDDTKLVEDVDLLPEPQGELGPGTRPASDTAIAIDGARAILRALVSRKDGTGDQQPQVAIPSDALWSSFVGVSSAIVTSPDGNTAAWYKRDSKRFRREMLEGLRISKRLLRQWKYLSRSYRDYDMASVKAWQSIIDKSEQR